MGHGKQCVWYEPVPDPLLSALLAKLCSVRAHGLSCYRYTYGETLGRWRTADLLIGLAYLSRKEAQEHPAADIARQARPLGEGMSLEQLEESMVSFS